MFFKNYTFDTLKIIKSSPVKYLLLIPVGVTLYFGYNFPVHVDESMTYFDFIKAPLWEALFLYPAPNNHVFYSILANLTEQISFLDLAFRIRIPSILSYIFTWILVYRFVRKYYSENVALFIFTLGATLVTTIEYSYMARGYTFVMLFVVICTYSAFNIIHKDNTKRNWLFFTLSSILGAFTMPSFLYPFITISTYIFIYNYQYFKTQLFYTILVGLGVFIVYTPILVFSGIDLIANNQYVVPIERTHVLKSIPGYISGVFVHIFCLPRIITTLIILLPVIFSIYKKDRQTLALWAFFFIIPSICLVLHSVLPFFRVFFYYGFIIIFLIAISIKELINEMPLKVLFTTLITCQILLIIHFFNNIEYLQLDSIRSKIITNEILEDKKTYYIKSHLLPILYSKNLAFEAERSKYSYKIIIGEEDNMDKLLDYDYCIIIPMDDKTQERKIFKSYMGLLHHPLNIYKKKPQ